MAQESETKIEKTHYNHNHDLDILARGKALASGHCGEQGNVHAKQAARAFTGVFLLCIALSLMFSSTEISVNFMSPHILRSNHLPGYFDLAAPGVLLPSMR